LALPSTELGVRDFEKLFKDSRRQYQVP